MTFSGCPIIFMLISLCSSAPSRNFLGRLETERIRNIWGNSENSVEDRLQNLFHVEYEPGKLNVDAVEKSGCVVVSDTDRTLLNLYKQVIDNTKLLHRISAQLLSGQVNEDKNEAKSPADSKKPANPAIEKESDPMEETSENGSQNNAEIGKEPEPLTLKEILQSVTKEKQEGQNSTKKEATGNTEQAPKERVEKKNHNRAVNGTKKSKETEEPEEETETGGGGSKQETEPEAVETKENHNGEVNGTKTSEETTEKPNEETETGGGGGSKQETETKVAIGPENPDPDNVSNLIQRLEKLLAEAPDSAKDSLKKALAKARNFLVENSDNQENNGETAEKVKGTDKSVKTEDGEKIEESEETEDGEKIEESVKTEDGEKIEESEETEDREKIKESVKKEGEKIEESEETEDGEKIEEAEVTETITRQGDDDDEQEARRISNRKNKKDRNDDDEDYDDDERRKKNKSRRRNNAKRRGNNRFLIRGRQTLQRNEDGVGETVQTPVRSPVISVVDPKQE